MNKDTPKALDAVSEREAFEAHWKLKYGQKPETWNEAVEKYDGAQVPTGRGDHYYIRTAQDAWEMWQARATLSTSTQQAAKSAHGCQGPECRDGILHKSDCAVHNGDALPVGPCDCGAAKSAAPAAVGLPAEASDAMCEAAMEAHYGVRRVRACGGARGIDMTVDDHGYNGLQAFRRMWRGAMRALSAPMPATQAPAAVGLTDEQIGTMLSELDDIARNVDSYDYGLPLWDEPIAEMRAVVRSHLSAPMPAGAAVGDTALLDALRENSWDLRCIDVPTGQGDADIHWTVIEHHEGKPHEREVGRCYSDEPRDAIRAAIAATTPTTGGEQS